MQKVVLLRSLFSTDSDLTFAVYGLIPGHALLSVMISVFFRIVLFYSKLNMMQDFNSLLDFQVESSLIICCRPDMKIPLSVNPQWFTGAVR